MTGRINIPQDHLLIYLVQNPRILVAKSQQLLMCFLFPCPEVKDCTKPLPSWLSECCIFVFPEGQSGMFCYFPQCFPHILSLEKCERQSRKPPALCMSEPAYTECQQMAIFYHYYITQRPFICGCGEHEESTLVWHMSPKLHPPLTVLLFVTVKLRVLLCVTFLTCTRVH